MQLTVQFENGMYKETNINDATISDAPSRCLGTEYNLRLDLLNEGELRVDTYWFMKQSAGRVSIGAETPSEYAERYQGFSICLLDKTELDKAVQITVSSGSQSTTVMRREGSGRWEIDGMVYERAVEQYYSDSDHSGTNQKTVKTFNYLREAYGLTDQEAAEKLGYPLDAIKEIVESESRVAEEDKDEGGDGDSESTEIRHTTPQEKASGLVIDEEEDEAQRRLLEAMDDEDEDDDPFGI